MASQKQPPIFFLDSKTIQIYGHHEEFYFSAFGVKLPNPNYQHRLSTFYSILKTFSQLETPYKIGSITKEAIKDIRCLLILTRSQIFSENELEVIADFLKDPDHSLLFMSNHDPDNKYDKKLANLLEIQLTGGYRNKVRGNFSTIEEDCLLNHPIITGANKFTPISKIITNTMCRIITKHGEPMAYLPKDVIGIWESRDEPYIPNKVFGVIINGKTEQNYPFKGKIAVMADSGWIGDLDSTFPGYGVIHLGDNQQFLLNILKYLLDTENQ
jgi:hypothetical protein